ncbi:hypothetical protein ABZ714_28815 [Streptomyces sp. NPDC006798]|uniref:hypothetical protein n=1 Tax=Streptomyces sp. NPDC006798 TaxID=3155462 RepID=UPI0033DD1DA7
MTRTPNVLLREVIAESGLTYAALAREIRCAAAECGVTLRTNKSAVEHWISGTRPVPATGRFIAVALSRATGRLISPADLGLGPAAGPVEEGAIGLSLTGDPLDTLLPMWRHELDRRRVLAASAYSVAAASLPLSYVREMAARADAARTGRRVGMAEVAAVRDMITFFTEMDERHGGRHGRSALVQYLSDDVAALVQYLSDDVAALVRGNFRNDEARRQMLSAASRGDHLLGWKSYDAGHQGLAQRYYLQSYALAVESGIPGQDGFVIRTMAMQGLKIHRPEHCRALAETGLARVQGTADAETEALVRVVHAHTLAKAGQRTKALAETDRAHALLDVRDGGEAPFWAQAWGPARPGVYSRTAKVHATLGDYQTGAAYLMRSAASWPSTEYARIVALDLVAAAEMQLKQGGIEQACATWNRALDHMDGIQSARTRKAIVGIRRDLAPFRARGARSAATLDERARTLLT